MRLLTLPGSDSLSLRAKALVFEDPKSRALLARIHQIAPSSATVLITGETGTGKEIVARHVHELSARRDRPFVAVNCGAFTDTLVESELFGHERGAFTGAIQAKAGWFESAHGGTLFLDEIGDLTPQLQVKLLRVLQEGEVVRVGSRQPIAVDVRFVGATNVDLEQAVAAGHFREDLYYRLNVAGLTLPALRERPGDILPLARYFLELYERRLNVPRAELTPEAERRMLEHPWPGNIRELENAVHHALLVCQGTQIQPEHLRLTTLRPRASASTPPPAPEASLETSLVALFERNAPDLHQHVERTLFRIAFEHCHRNQVQTARLLGVSRNVVRARLIQYGELAALPRISQGVPAPDRAESFALPHEGGAPWDPSG